MPLPFKIFIDDPQIEAEILHDKKWPRLLVNSTGEILSVGMAKRIMRYFNEGLTFEEVPLKFREEWDRDICADTAEAVYNMDFDTTDAPVPSGEHVVAVDDPLIDHPEFVRGVVVPSGIYYEIVNLRDCGVSFVEKYALARWGFEVDEESIGNIWDDWMDNLPTDEDGRPITPQGDARPPRPGRRPHGLETEVNEARGGRSPSSFPLPLYEPRPTWGNMTFRHPGEVDVLGGQLPSFNDTSNNTDPPPYSSEAEPVAVSATNLRSRPESSSVHPPPVQEGAEAGGESSRRILAPAQRAVTSQVNPGSGVPRNSDTKPSGWGNPDDGILRDIFTKQDIVEYLSDQYRDDPNDIPSVIYPYGPYHPVPLPSRENYQTTSRIRQVIDEGRYRRVIEGQIERDVDFRHPTPYETVDYLMIKTVRGLFELLQPDVTTRIPYYENLKPSANIIGLVYHLRRAHHLGVAALHDDSANLTSGVLKLLHKLGNDIVKLTLYSFSRGARGPHKYTFASFVEFVDEVKMRTQISGRGKPVSNKRFDHDMGDTETSMNYLVIKSTQKLNSMFGPLIVGPTNPHRRFHLTIPIPAGGIEPHAQFRNAVDTSTRIVTGHHEKWDNLHQLRIERHTRILGHLQNWLVLLSNIPENIETANRIEVCLKEYKEVIDQCKLSTDEDPRLWKQGYQIEDEIGDLEIQTFAAMLRLSPNCPEQKSAPYKKWLSRWVNAFQMDIDLLHAEFWCLTNNVLRVRSLPTRGSETRVITHDIVIRDLFPVMKEFERLEHGREWTRLRSILHEAVGGTRVRMPWCLVDLRYKVRTALLTLDSLLIVTKDTFPDEERNAANPRTIAGAGINGPALFLAPGRAVESPASNDTDQPPIRELGMGEHRRLTYGKGLLDWEIARGLVYSPPRRLPTPPTDADGDSEMTDTNSDESSDSSGGMDASTSPPADEDDEEPLVIQPPPPRPAHDPQLPLLRPVRYQPPPPRPAHNPQPIPSLTYEQHLALRQEDLRHREAHVPSLMPGSLGYFLPSNRPRQPTLWPRYLHLHQDSEPLGPRYGYLRQDSHNHPLQQTSQVDSSSEDDAEGETDEE